MTTRKAVPLKFPVFPVTPSASEQLATFLSHQIAAWEADGWRLVGIETLTIPKMIKSSMLTTDQGSVVAQVAILEHD